MIDKNGTDIKTGDIVQITGAYFKKDNATYFVARSPGDTGWSGKDYSLHKISKRGKIAPSHNVAFWPLFVTVNDCFKRAEAKDWNREHAQIEILHTIDRAEVIEHFESESDDMAEVAKHYEWQWGTDNESTKLYRTIAKEKHAVAERIRMEESA